MATLTDSFTYNDTSDTSGSWGSTTSSFSDNTSYAYSSVSNGSYSYYAPYRFKKYAQVPAGSTINTIKLSVRAYIVSGTYGGADCDLYVSLEGPTALYYRYFWNDVADGVATTYNVTKTPTQWSISQAEAYDVVTDPNYSTNIWVGFRNQSGNTETIRIEYVELEVDYTAPPSIGQYIIGNQF